MPWLSAFYVFWLSRLELTNRENKTADFEYMLLSSYRDRLIPWQPSLKKTFWCSVCTLKTLCSLYGCFVYQVVCFLVTDYFFSVIIKENKTEASVIVVDPSIINVVCFYFCNKKYLSEIFLYITTSCCVFLYNQSGLHAMVLKTKLHLCLCSPVFLLSLYLSDISHTYTLPWLLTFIFLHTHTLAPVLEEDLSLLQTLNALAERGRWWWPDASFSRAVIFTEWLEVLTLMLYSAIYRHIEPDINVFSSSVKYKHTLSFEIQILIFSRFYLFLLICIHLKDYFFIYQKHNIIWLILNISCPILGDRS